MSETVSDDIEIGGGETASEADVKRTLEELQRKTESLEKEVRAERSRRTALETSLDTERVARTTAELERDQHATRVVSEAEQRWAAEKAAAEAAVAARTAALEAAEEDYARHAELGEWKEAAKVQTNIGKLTAELHDNSRKLEYLESNKERIVPKAPTRVETPAAPAPQATHRYSRFIAGPLVGGEEAWLDARPEFATDATYRQDVIDASNLAGRRHERGSEAYLRAIERILDEDSGSTGERDPEPQPRQSGRTAPRTPSADLPASRRAAPGQQPAGAQDRVRLSPEEAEMADGMYGNANEPEWYIADKTQRYLRYHENKMKMAARQ